MLDKPTSYLRSMSRGFESLPHCWTTIRTKEGRQMIGLLNRYPLLTTASQARRAPRVATPSASQARRAPRVATPFGLASEAALHGGHLSLPIDKISDTADPQTGLVLKSDMTRIWQDDQFRAGDLFMHFLGKRRITFIMIAADNQGRHFDCG